MVPFRPLIAFPALSVVGHLDECKPARQPGVAIHDNMNLHHLSVGLEQPSKLLVRHLRTQVSNKEVFHDVSPYLYCLIVGCSRAIVQEAEVEKAANTAYACACC